MPTPTRRFLRKINPLPADLDRTEPVARLVVRQTILVLGGLGALLIVVGVVVFFSSGAREAADGAEVAANVGVDNGRRSACITDLRSAETAAAYKVADADGKVNDAVLNRLAVLDGTNPETREPITSEAEQGRLADEYVIAGLNARVERIKATRNREAASAMLEQPALNDTCGAPAGGPAPFESCDEARAAGPTPISPSSPGWNPDLDADGNGEAC